MRWGKLATALLLSATSVSAGRSLLHAGKQFEERAKRLAKPVGERAYNENVKRDASAPLFLTENTSSESKPEVGGTIERQETNALSPEFSVNGSAIPDVDFDVGESYAGQLPISSDPDDKNRLFFWFFPSENPAAEKEILIWLNGGVSCPSLISHVRMLTWLPNSLVVLRSRGSSKKMALSSGNTGLTGPLKTRGVGTS